MTKLFKLLAGLALACVSFPAFADTYRGDLRIGDGYCYAFKSHWQLCYDSGTTHAVVPARHTRRSALGYHRERRARERSLQQPPQLVFVDHRNAELLRFYEFASGVTAGNDVIRFFAHRSGYFTARGDDPLRRLFTREVWKRAREDEGSSRERSVGARAFWRSRVDACSGKPRDHFSIRLLLEKKCHAPGNLGTDPFAALQFVVAGFCDCFDRSEVAGENLCGLHSDEANA